MSKKTKEMEAQMRKVGEQMVKIGESISAAFNQIEIREGQCLKSGK